MQGGNTNISSPSPQNSTFLNQDLFDCLANSINPKLADRNKQLSIENEYLKNEIATLRETKTNYQELASLYAKQSIELSKCRKQLAANASTPNSTCVPLHNYVIDMTDFDENATIDDVNYLFNSLHSLVDKKIDKDAYLIDCASAVVPIYIMLTDSQKLKDTKWHYCGTLTSFCDYWNTNIAQHIEDPERAKQLECNYNSIKAETKKAPWKSSSPAKWRTIMTEKTKYNKSLSRAYNIKRWIESELI